MCKQANLLEWQVIKLIYLLKLILGSNDCKKAVERCIIKWIESIYQSENETTREEAL